MSSLPEESTKKHRETDEVAGAGDLKRFFLKQLLEYCW